MPSTLAVSGRHADGTILAEPVTPEYLRSAQSHLKAQATHDIVAYNVAAVDDDPDAARAQVRPALSWVGHPAWSPHLAPLPFAYELARLARTAATAAELTRLLPDAWVDQLAVVGTSSQARERMRQLHAGGANHLVLSAAGMNPFHGLDQLAKLR